MDSHGKTPINPELLDDMMIDTVEKRWNTADTVQKESAEGKTRGLMSQLTKFIRTKLVC